MKIGILTYHRTLNYGGCLQALATRLVLEQMGHEVYYVDYWPSYHKRMYKAFSWNKFWQGGFKYKIKYLLNSFHDYPYIEKRRSNFQRFFDKYINPFCKSTNEDFDVVVYGSDQIWRKQDATQSYNPIYFGNNDIRAKRHVAFSASMGILPQTDEEKKTVKKLLSAFDQIAVREAELKELLLGMGYTDAVQTLDPTLLMDSEYWDRYIPQEAYTGEKYVLVYALHPEVFDMQAIRKFAKLKGLMVKVLSGHADCDDTETYISLAGPDEFLRLIRNAEYVFSSSFHGLVFSIIYNKEVFVSFSDNAGRALSLLEAVGLPERFLPIQSNIPVDVKEIDYLSVNHRLCTLRKSSLDFLKSL